jgi:hypothetical protein
VGRLSSPAGRHAYWKKYVVNMLLHNVQGLARYRDIVHMRFNIRSARGIEVYKSNRVTSGSCTRLGRQPLLVLQFKCTGLLDDRAVEDWGATW